MVKYIVIEEGEPIQCEHFHKTISGATRCLLSKDGFWINPIIKKVTNGKVLGLNREEREIVKDFEHRLIWGRFEKVTI